MIIGSNRKSWECELKGEFVIGSEWDQDLLNPDSEKFQMISKTIREGLAEILKHNKNVNVKVDIKKIDLKYR